MHTPARRIVWLVAVVVYMLGLAWFSTQPGPDKQSGQYSLAMEHFKNFLHFPAYGGLAWLWIKVFNSIQARALVLAFLITTGWGILNEFIQSHTPNRFYSLEDMAVNALGALAVIALAGTRVIGVVE